MPARLQLPTPPAQRLAQRTHRQGRETRESGGPPMNDLRDRIAAVIEAHHQADEWGYPVEECRCGDQCFGGSWAQHVAGALIAELDDALDDTIYDAVDELITNHGGDDNQCRCGTRNNMDGDVLHAHRVGVVMENIRDALGIADE
jgi:hypothetical protein